MHMICGHTALQCFKHVNSTFVIVSRTQDIYMPFLSQMCIIPKLWVACRPGRWVEEIQHQAWMQLPFMTNAIFSGDERICLWWQTHSSSAKNVFTFGDKRICLQQRTCVRMYYLVSDWYCTIVWCNTIHTLTIVKLFDYVNYLTLQRRMKDFTSAWVNLF